MKLSYNKLWKILIDKNMTRSSLQKAAGISSASIAKLGRGDSISTDVLIKICVALDCRVEDIFETIDE
jgi:DNA-binding Xre family transcriptional regulator